MRQYHDPRPRTAPESTGEHAVEVVGGSNVVLSAITVNNPAATGVLVRDVGGTNRIDNNSLITHIDARASATGHGVYVFNNNVNMTLFDFRNSRITNNVSGERDVLRGQRRHGEHAGGRPGQQSSTT